MSTVALCALLLAATAGDGAEKKQTRTIEEINDLNANKSDDETEDSSDAAQERLKASRGDARDAKEIDTSSIDRLNINGWPAASRRAAADTVRRFGQPDETTDDKLVWRDAGSFKKIMVSRETTPHHFPAPHADVLTYVIDYKVPPSRFDDLAHFDGSVHADRTKGELSVRCDRHEMNIAALNLADEIIRGQRTVAQSRKLLSSVQKSVKRDDPPAIARRLRFDATRSATADIDRPGNRAMGR